MKENNSRNDSNDLKFEVLSQAIVGTVGKGAATEFKEFLKIRKQFPSIDSILNGQDIILKSADIACAVVTALATRAKLEHFERLLKYSYIIGEELGVMLVKLLAHRDQKELEKYPSWEEWAKKHKDVIF